MLTLSLAANAVLYRKASRPLFEEGDRPLIERTIADAVRSRRLGADDIRSETFPVVMHLGIGSASSCAAGTASATPAPATTARGG